MKDIIKYITDDRLKPYLELTNQNINNAIDLYLLYTKINESFYLPLQNIEIIIRNSFYNILAEKYGDNWILEQSHLLCGLSGKKRLLQEQIDFITSDVKYRKKLFNKNDIISNLNFNFWLIFLNDDFEIYFWRSSIRKLFSKYSDKVLRKDIQKELKFIKGIRNRVFHHENLLKYNLLESYNKIIYFINLISEDFANWTNKNANFIENYNNLKNFILLNNINIII